jgi:hypothetical protein
MLEQLLETLGQLIALKGLWMGWCPSLKEILDGMAMNLLQNCLVYMVVDHTIAFPSNFPQNVKNIDVVSAKNIYKYHNKLECGVIVALVENFESYFKEGQLITTIIVLKNKCQGEFSRFCEV